MIELTTQLIALMVLAVLHDASRMRPRPGAMAASLGVSAAGAAALALLADLELALHGFAI